MCNGEGYLFGVFTYTLRHFLAKTIFPEGMEGVQNSNENSRVVGVILVVKKMEIPGRRGREDLHVSEFPLWWGNGYFLELHIKETNHKN